MDVRKVAVMGRIAAGLLVVGALASSCAGDDMTDVSPVYLDQPDGSAIEGYDAVGYFTEGEAVQGSGEFSLEYRGAQWLFASEENRQLFKDDPTKYAPAYGGHCAYGVSSGYGVRGDPEQWSIVDGRLYLNYNADVKAEWSKDVPGYLAKSEVAWPKLCTDKANCS